jgi:hypothetical protein
MLPLSVGSSSVLGRVTSGRWPRGGWAEAAHANARTTDAPDKNLKLNILKKADAAAKLALRDRV